MMTGEFKMYDYDFEKRRQIPAVKPEESENFRRYGQLKPPVYPL